jgi:alkaline phosphatase
MRDRKAAGVVSTTNIWDATPAAFVSHAAVRSQDRDIAEQMVRDTRPEVILGGGAKAFAPSPGSLKPSRRLDLVESAEKSGYTVVSSADELAALDLASTTRLLGLVAGSGFDYEADPNRDPSEPHLTDMARAAITVLSNDPRGFFLMIEGANIDHAGHATNLDLQVGEMVEFDRTVNMVLDWAQSHPDTLVLITADHETGGIDVLPGDYHQGDKVEVNWTTRFLPGAASHSSRQVPIYGIGPNAGAIKRHLDDTEIFCIIRNAFGDVPQ